MVSFGDDMRFVPQRVMFVSTVLMIAVAALLAGCKHATDSGIHQVKIGAILDLTGPAASFGQMQREGIELAAADLNISPACKYQMLPVIEDSRLDPKLAIGAATKLVYDDKVAAVSSITGSSMALVTAPVFGKAGVPVLDSLSSAPSLTGQGNGFYFRIQPPDTYAGKYLVSWAGEFPRVHRVAIIYAESDWGQGLRDSIMVAARAAHMDVVIAESARPGEIDFRPALLRIRRRNPDLLFLVAHPQEGGLIIKQLALIGYKIPVMGSDSLSTEEVKTAAGRALDGVLFCLSSTGKGPAYEAFQQRFKRRFGTEATVNSIKPYDAFMIIAKTVCEAGTDGKAIRQGLLNMPSYQGISGSISFDEHGDIRDPSYDRFQFHGDKYLAVDSTK